jgi:hypothetical protein
VSAENQVFDLKYSFSRPLDSAARGGRTIPHSGYALAVQYVSILYNKLQDLILFFTL